MQAWPCSMKNILSKIFIRIFKISVESLIFRLPLTWTWQSCMKIIPSLKLSFKNINLLWHINSALLRAIFTSPIFRINYVIGRLRDSFMMGFTVDGFKIHLFYVYNHNNVSVINGVKTPQKQRVRQTYPRQNGQICTGELHDRLIHLPCDYQKIIEVIKNKNILVT